MDMLGLEEDFQEISNTSREIRFSRKKVSTLSFEDIKFKIKV